MYINGAAESAPAPPSDLLHAFSRSSHEKLAIYEGAKGGVKAIPCRTRRSRSNLVPVLEKPRALGRHPRRPLDPIQFIHGPFSHRRKRQVSSSSTICPRCPRRSNVSRLQMNPAHSHIARFELLARLPLEAESPPSLSSSHYAYPSTVSVQRSPRGSRPSEIRIRLSRDSELSKATKLSPTPPCPCDPSPLSCGSYLVPQLR